MDSMNRITKEEALLLLDEHDLIKLGKLATQAKQRHHAQDKPVTFVIDRNINYTNVCSCKCKFCAFYRESDHKESYVLDYSVIKQKTRELVDSGGTQLLLQGGLNPDIKLEYYLSMVKNLRDDFPGLTIHAFSPPEIAYIAEQNSLSPEELLEELIKAGLSSIPGGGAEILSDSIRSKISPNKISSDKWLDIMRTAHNLGLKTTATMVFGLGESKEEIIEHLFKIRELQDETGGFTAFIPWSFQPSNTELNLRKKSTAFDYLKIVAVSRIVLDNIKNIQASWVTQGMAIAQLSLSFGSNDFGGTMMEENVVRAAGVVNMTSTREIILTVKNAGFIPAQRDTAYNILKIH